MQNTEEDSLILDTTRANDMIEDKRNQWRQFINDNRGKIKLLTGSIDQKAWVNLDSELKVYLTDPHVRAEQLLYKINDVEETVNKLLDS